ncbi:FAD-dependent oxidoreductase [Streptomyces sp. G45]|uniref:FAD-dependent oxidoreductase n=1 Tax=Streptomyces sp. G45 TaxID=3406627 RepID=UPI003C182F83
MHSSPRAEVIGAGIGGLTAAAALARCGWSVRLHERQSEIRAAGAGIYVWDNGLYALDAVGAFEEATQDAHIGPAVEARSRQGRTLYRIAINGPDQPRCYTLLRDRLMRALVAAARAAGVEIVTSSQATRAHADGRVEFEGAPDARADLVVAADGVHSRLRDRLGLARRRTRMRQGAARLMVPASADYLPAADAPLHLEHFQGRRRLLYTPCTADAVYLALVSDASDPAVRGARIDAASWTRSFPTLGALIDQAAQVETRWDTFELIQLRSWSHGRVAFLGDCAHAQPPYLGQGGGTAMNNAVALAASVSRPGAGGTAREHVPASLAVWEREQRPGTERTQRTSYRMRLLNQIPDAARDALLTAVSRSPRVARSQLAATRLRPATPLPLMNPPANPPAIPRANLPADSDGDGYDRTKDKEQER